ncbi:MAG: PVC-type heme-binding CxxCH protein [Pirellulales bacterium]
MPLPIVLIVALSSGALNGQTAPPEPPASSLAASLEPRPGFQVELVAAEPLVESPVAFDWDTDGSLWVVEMRDYPLGMDNKGQPGGRIVRLSDADGDRRYDTSIVFLDGLLFPASVMTWRKGVLVACAPDIFYAEDSDGDGRADKKEVLFSGFGEANPQHRVNGLRWGLDNWLYCANGDFAPARQLAPAVPADKTATGFSASQTEDLRRLALAGAQVRSVKTGTTYDIRNRDFRFRPDEGLLDPQSGQSQFGRDRDDWGNWFGCHHATPMWHYALDDRYLRRNPHVASPSARVEAPRSLSFAIGGGRDTGTPRDSQGNAWTSGSSVMVYRDTLFGPGFADNWFACEPVHNLVHREILHPRGVTFTSHRAPDEEASEFLASADPMFTPVSIRTGPDGALWIADMHRKVLEHPHWLPSGWETSVDVRAGHEQGRIYRVYPAGKRPRAWPRLDRLETAELVALLDSPNGWLRDKAQQLLIHAGDRSAIQELEAKAAAGKTALGRLHALCTLDGLEALTPDVLRQALTDPHPAVRRHAIRLSEAPACRSAEVEARLTALACDPDPHVRLQLACTLGCWESARCAETLGRLLSEDHSDPYISAAALSSLTRGNVAIVVETVLAASKETPPALVQALLQSAVGFDEPHTAAALVDRLARPRSEGFSDGQFAALAGWLDALDQRNTPLSELAREADAPLRGSLSRLSELFQAARQVAADPAAPPSRRAVAVRLLGRGLDQHKDEWDILAELLAPQTEEGLAAAAVDTLGAIRDPRAAEALLRDWKRYTPQIRFAVLDVLVSRPGGAQAVLEALRGERMLPQEVPLELRQRLLEHPDEEVRAEAGRTFTDLVDPDRDKVVQAFQSALDLDGDADRGQKLFAKHCAACHLVGTVGAAVGPDLVMVRDKPAEWFLPALFDPSRAVDAKYLNYVAVTKDGKLHTGVLAEEGGNSITLVGAKGERQVVLRDNLDELAGTGKSAMPEGLEQELNPQDVADLITWLKKM